MRRRIAGLLYMAAALFLVLSLFWGWFMVRFLSHGGEYVIGFLESTGARITAGAGNGSLWWGFVAYPDGSTGRLEVTYGREPFADPGAKNVVAIGPDVSYMKIESGTRLYKWATAKWTIDVKEVVNTDVVEPRLLALTSGKPPTADYACRLNYCLRLVQTNYHESMDFISRHAPYLRVWAELRRIVVKSWAYALAVVPPEVVGALEYVWIIALSALSFGMGRVGWLSLRRKL